MPYTALKRLSVQTAGSNSGTWGAGGVSGDDLNTGCFGLIDTQLAGVSSFSVSASNVSLSYANIQTCLFRFTGVLTSSIVVSPAAGDAATYFNGFYYWENLTTGSFSITVTTGAGSVVLPQSRRGVMFVDGTNGPRIMSIVASSGSEPVPVGSVLVFYQNAAPTGYTIVSSLNDYALKIVSSSGGVTSGSIAYSTVFGRTSTDDYALTTSEIPQHTHAWSYYPSPRPTGSGGGTMIEMSSAVSTSGVQGTGFQISNTGGGGSHSHAIDLRVRTAAVILATKAA